MTSHTHHAFFKLFRHRAFAAVLLLLPLTAGAPAWHATLPPPPRFVPVPLDVHVLAVHVGGAPETTAPLNGPGAPAGDTTLVSKTAGAASVAPDGILHYGVSVTNATTTFQTFRLTDTLPSGVTYVNSSATGGFVYNSASASLTATVPLAAFVGNVIIASGAPTYTEISSTGQDICLHYFPACDDNSITLGGVPFRYLGVDYTTVTLDSNGFVTPGSANPGPANQNQNLPDPALPNNVIAPFWADLDLLGNSPGDSGGGQWFYGVEQDKGSGFNYLVVEWLNAQRKGTSSTHYSFQVWIQLNAEHITFAYQDMHGPASPATIGFENSNGTLGASYLFNGAGSVPAAGTQLQIVGQYATAALGYDVRASHNLPGCSALTNTVNLSGSSGAATDSATATTAVFGPCRFFPLVRR